MVRQMRGTMPMVQPGDAYMSPGCFGGLATLRSFAHAPYLCLATPLRAGLELRLTGLACQLDAPSILDFGLVSVLHGALLSGLLRLLLPELETPSLYFFFF